MRSRSVARARDVAGGAWGLCASLPSREGAVGPRVTRPTPRARRGYSAGAEAGTAASVAIETRMSSADAAEATAASPSMVASRSA